MASGDFVCLPLAYPSAYLEGRVPKLSKPLISALNPTDQDVVVWDSSLPGFGLRAKASGVKTFVIQYRNRSGRSRRLSLGNLGKVTLDQARKEAVRLMGQVAAGGDPAEERRRI